MGKITEIKHYHFLSFYPDLSCVFVLDVVVLYNVNDYIFLKTLFCFTLHD